MTRCRRSGDTEVLGRGTFFTFPELCHGVEVVSNESRQLETMECFHILWSFGAFRFIAEIAEITET